MKVKISPHNLSAPKRAIFIVDFIHTKPTKETLKNHEWNVCDDLSHNMHRKNVSTLNNRRNETLLD
jgi:hypothetical protein